ncbi:MAG TPA: flagellar hook-length control protein FliK [bacterium]|jgi:flagellar hook-length control protein FliK|nr:flagellar hook-length control protein FliK [bacterium]
MRIRPQIEVPNVKSGPPVTSQAQAASEAHFDAALLQAAQVVSDSEPEAFGALAPKVQQALSSALEQLNQKTPSQLQVLVRQPQALAALTAGLAQSDGLNSAQTGQLTKLLQLALPRLLAYKTSVETAAGAGTSKTPAPSTAAAQSAPQGGSPAVSAFPADFFSALSSQAGTALESGSAPLQNFSRASDLVPRGQATPQDPSSAPVPPQGFGVLPALPNPVQGIPVQPAQDSVFTPAASAGGQGPAPQSPTSQRFVSPGTGQGLPFGAAQSVPPAGQAPSPAASAPTVLSTDSGAMRVFSVAVNPGQSAPQAGEPSQAPLYSAGAQPQQANGAAAQNNATAGPQASAPVSAQGPVQNGNQGQGMAPISSQNGTTDTGFPVLLDLAAQITDSSAPLPIQAGSQVTLRGDGTWVLPQGAPQPAANARPAAPVQPQTQASTPQTSGNQEQPSAPELPSLPGSVAPPSAPQVAGLNETVDAQASAVPSPGLVEDPFFQDLASQQTDGELPGPGNGAQASSAQALAQQGLAQGASQVQSSQQLVAQIPVLTQALQNSGAQGQPGAGTDKTLASAEFDPMGTQGSGQAQGGAGQAPGVSSQSTFGGTLASFGQSPMQALADQTLQDYGLQKNLSQQISTALNEAGAASPGRLVIQLSPAGLGNVQVDLSMVAGKLTAHLVATSQDVRDVLARDLSGFKASLESHGIIVNEVSVAVHANAGDAQQGSPDQGQGGQNWWRSLPSTGPSEITAIPGGLSAYDAASAGAQQGFNALA